MDIWWNPALENQAIDRVHRIGQMKDVVVHRIFINNTVEDRILELQRKKQVKSRRKKFTQTMKQCTDKGKTDNRRWQTVHSATQPLCD